MIQFQSVSRAVWIVPVVLLLLAFDNLPLGYYSFLRLVVVLSCGLLAYMEFQSTRTLSIWVVFFALVGVLYNPAMPIELPKELWNVVDALVAFLYVGHMTAVDTRLARRSIVTQSRRLASYLWQRRNATLIAIAVVVLVFGFGSVFGVSRLGSALGGAIAATGLYILPRKIDSFSAPPIAEGKAHY